LDGGCDDDYGQEGEEERKQLQWADFSIWTSIFVGFSVLLKLLVNVRRDDVLDAAADDVAEDVALHARHVDEGSNGKKHKKGRFVGVKYEEKRL
jgi:hypothetical protein